jgi:hypothetical protein
MSIITVAELWVAIFIVFVVIPLLVIYLPDILKEKARFGGIRRQKCAIIVSHVIQFIVFAGLVWIIYESRPLNVSLGWEFLVSLFAVLLLFALRLLSYCRKK